MEGFLGGIEGMAWWEAAFYGLHWVEWVGGWNRDGMGWDKERAGWLGGFYIPIPLQADNTYA